MTKYKNINYVTLVAMLMIINIHFFNEFSTNVGPESKLIMNTLRGFALPAVTLYLVNTAYTSFYLNKGVNYGRIFIYILIPTLLLTQAQHYLVGLDPVSFSFSQGFNYSWFGEMYLYVMMLVPLGLYLNTKSKSTRNLMLVISIVLTVWGFYYSITAGTPTLSNLHFKMMFPYIGLIYVMYRMIEVLINVVDKLEDKKLIQIVLLVLIIISGIVETLAYSGIITHTLYVKSYFSIPTITFAVSIWALIYSLDLSKFPEIRTITKGSYFLFFVHWIIIRMFETYALDFTANHVWIMYIIIILSSYIVSTILFTIYEILVVKVLKIK